MFWSNTNLFTLTRAKMCWTSTPTSCLTTQCDCGGTVCFFNHRNKRLFSFLFYFFLIYFFNPLVFFFPFLLAEFFFLQTRRAPSACRFQPHQPANVLFISAVAIFMPVCLYLATDHQRIFVMSVCCVSSSSSEWMLRNC